MRRDIADSAEYSRSPVIAGLPGFHAVQFQPIGSWHSDFLRRFPKRLPARKEPQNTQPAHTPKLISFFQGQFVASAVGTTPRACLQPVAMCLSSQPGNKHIPRETREQKSRHRVDCLNGRRVVSANGKLSAEINREQPTRQYVEHEPK